MSSTFVNFIHQKDARLAMSVVNFLLSDSSTPIYTVHDNFLSTADCSSILPLFYTYAYKEMGPPLPSSIPNEQHDLDLSFVPFGRSDT
ncbi:hypothetical protein AgCh_006705 [Apium graveolens]